MRDLHFESLTVHAGAPEQRPRPTVSPIYTATSYVYASTDDLDAAFMGEGAYYQRNGNPTTATFENACAAMEGAEGAVAFASGMAALHGAMVAAGVQSGDTIVAARDLYGVTSYMLRDTFAASGITTHFADLTDLDGAKAAIEAHRPRAVVCESLSNPLLRLADIERLAELAHAAGAVLVVDNTFPTPWLLRPHDLGADLVVHSATKYIGGHGNALGGVVTANGFLLDPLREASVVLGAVLAPFEAVMLLYGSRTLALRIARQNANAAEVARWLAEQPQVARVHYPGLPWHPQHALATRLFGGRGYGAMVSFELRENTRAAVSSFIDGLRLALPGPTLGDVTTLVMSPLIASHRGLTPAERAELGIADGLVRISVGIEHPSDIIADMEQALARAPEPVAP